MAVSVIGSTLAGYFFQPRDQIYLEIYSIYLGTLLLIPVAAVINITVASIRPRSTFAMASPLKRKASPEMDETADHAATPKRQAAEVGTHEQHPHDVDDEDAGVALPSDNQEDGDGQLQSKEGGSAPLNSRLAAQKERFAALQKRQTESRKNNRKEAGLESQRQSINPAAVASLNRKKATAEQKLQKADAEAAGEDYERKRAWDWTIDESERWDKRLAKKAAHRDDVAFQNYGQEARKVYKRQLRELGKPQLEEYESQKADAVRRAAEEGRLELVEKEDGEIIAVDREGTWFGGREGLDAIGKGKVEKDKVDRLVAELKKSEEVRLRKSRQRRGDDEREDVTYINEKNKVCVHHFQ